MGNGHRTNPKAMTPISRDPSLRLKDVRQSIERLSHNFLVLRRFQILVRLVSETIVCVCRGACVCVCAFVCVRVCMFVGRYMCLGA